MQNDAGRAEYKARKRRAWQRQNGICNLLGRAPNCPGPVSLAECQFEHAQGRTAGRRDDRIVDEHGEPMNGVVHPRCNRWKASRHFQAAIPAGFDPEEKVMADAGVYGEE